MSQRHPIQSDRIMFITTITKNREPFFAEPSCAREAIDTLYRVQGMYPFFLYGFAIMPDHSHYLIKVPFPNTISQVMHSYKRAVTFACGKGPIWQPRFHVRLLEDPAPALNYIFWNPVKAELCTNPQDYPWSSATGKWDITDLPLCM
jgi:putative transposase